jgi:hypothetical protein
MAQPHVTDLRPRRAIPGGRIDIEGAGFPVSAPRLPRVHIAGLPARVVCASSRRIGVLIPESIGESCAAPVHLEGVEEEPTFSVEVAAPFATGLHQVDNPVFDREGNLYVTYSGSRGQQVPVSIFRVRADGTRETFASGIVNPTSVAIGPDEKLYVSSRFEGTVFRLEQDGSSEVFASDLGVACGLAFASDGTLFVGDRTGTIFRVNREGHATPFATLPPSVAAFHLAFGPDGALYASAPTLSPYDPVYRIDSSGTVGERGGRFGRPQGLAFDANGDLFVVEALAGASGLMRVPAEGPPELVLAGPGLVGVAFAPDGGLVVCSNDTAYRLPA